MKNPIIHGECVKEMKKFPNNFIDLNVTSPPYDNLRAYKGYTFEFDKVEKHYIEKEDLFKKSDEEESINSIKLAQCLSNKNVFLYIMDNEPYSSKLLTYFGDTGKYLLIKNCGRYPDGLVNLPYYCTEIRGFPRWLSLETDVSGMIGYVGNDATYEENREGVLNHLKETFGC